mgnify:CR=1 FL=1
MKELSEIKADAQIHIQIEAPTGIVGNCKGMTFVMTWDDGWEHLSVSYRNRCPTWDEMCLMKSKFFKEDEACVQYHPKKSEYVNLHKYCLHIWRPLTQKLPTPPPRLVL